MQAWAEKLRKDGGPGVLLSLLLHLLLLLAALWYVHQRPALTETQLRALPVELVIGGTMGQQASTAPAARLQVARPHPESAPVPEGTNPKGTKAAGRRIVGQASGAGATEDARRGTCPMPTTPPRPAAPAAARAKAIMRSRISSGRRSSGAGCPIFPFPARATCRCWCGCGCSKAA